MDNSMDNSPARILEWVAMPFYRGSSQPKNGSSHIAGRFKDKIVSFLEGFHRD